MSVSVSQESSWPSLSQSAPPVLSISHTSSIPSPSSSASQASMLPSMSVSVSQESSWPSLSQSAPPVLSTSHTSSIPSPSSSGSQSSMSPSLSVSVSQSSGIPLVLQSLPGPVEIRHQLLRMPSSPPVISVAVIVQGPSVPSPLKSARVPGPVGCIGAPALSYGAALGAPLSS